MDFAGNEKADNRTGIIENNGFFPNIDIAEFARTYSVPTVINQETVRIQLELAMIDVYDELRHLIEPNKKLADLFRQIGETNKGEMLYFRAVFCTAKAALMRESGTMLLRKDANNELRTNETTEDKYREFADAAIRRLTGCFKATVGLL